MKRNARRAMQSPASTDENRLKLIAPATNPIHRVSTSVSRRFETDGDAAPRDLPDGWKRARLGDHIARPDYGYTASANEKPVGPKFLRITDIQDGRVYWNSVPYCKLSGDAKKEYLLQSGDIVVARIGATTGKSFLITQCPETAFASYLIRIRTQETLSPDFLNLFFETAEYWKQIDENKGGRLKGGVNIPILQNLGLPLPPLPEQHAIAHALRTVQQSRAARQRELTLERERKATLMEHLFTHGTRNEPRKQTEIGEMPESWRVVKLRELADLITKGSSPKWQGFEYRNDGVVFVRSQNVGWGRLELAEVAYLPEGFNRKEKKSIIKRNDLLINLVGASIGRAAVATEKIEGGNLNQAVAVVRLQESCVPHFAMYFILTEPGQVQLHKFEKDIARANVSLEDINNYLVPLPSIDEQETVIELLGASDRKITALERETQVLDELFRAMLDELMTGKLSAVPLILHG